MKSIIQRQVVTVLFLIFAAAASGMGQAVVAPAAFNSEGQHPAYAQADFSEEMKSYDARIHQILEEISAEQKRHQKKMESIKVELRELESNLPEKKWIPARVQWALDGSPESKER